MSNDRLVPKGTNVFEMCEWDNREVEIKNSDGDVIFKQTVEAPTFWSDQSVQIVASKYLYGDQEKGNDPKTGGREHSIKQLVWRVANTIAHSGMEQGYFDDEESMEEFRNELLFLLVFQYAAFNSPVWFNVGLNHEYGITEKGGSKSSWGWNNETGEAERVDCYERPTVAACFLIGPDDSIEDIWRVVGESASLFKQGSGVGGDWSDLRSSKEKISGGGVPSGPLSFMRVQDSTGGTVKSGGKNRRAAILQSLRVYHPDVMQFIHAKANEERKAHALIDAGYDGSFNGEAYKTVAFQNVNQSVRVTDEFMEAVVNGELYNLVDQDGNVLETIPAVEIMDAMAENAWFCGDPGIQYHDTINAWNPVPNSGEIKESNPCLTGESRILTKSGWVKIEDLNDQHVELFNGLGFELGKVWETGEKETVKLETNNGRIIELTPDHKIYTEEEGWIEAKDSEGLTIPYILPETLRYTGTNVPARGGKLNDGSSFSNISVNYSEILGFIHGDGSIRKDGNIHTVAVYYTPDKDKSFVDESVVPFLENMLSTGKGFAPIPDRNGYIVHDKKLVEWLLDIGMSTNNLPERTLPEFVFRLKNNTRNAFLRGLFSANGNVTTNENMKSVRLVSSNRDLLMEVQLLLQTTGIDSKVRIHNKEQDVEWDNGTYKSKESYHLEITHQEDLFLFAKLIGFVQDIQIEKLNSIISIDGVPNNYSARSKRGTMFIKSVTDGEVKTVYDFTVPSTHLGMVQGLIVSNCAEYNYIRNTACNLSSLNLLKFYEDGRINVDKLSHAARIMFTAQDIGINLAGYPSKIIAEMSHKHRPLGLGFANLGALLMTMGYGYGSKEGQAVAGCLMAIIDGSARHQSGVLASRVGTFEAYKENREEFQLIMRRHLNELYYNDLYSNNAPEYLFEAAETCQRDAEAIGHIYGYRNGQATNVAPTGSISFLMGCDTTGIEPALGLIQYKLLAGETDSWMKLVNNSVEPSLKNLGYSDKEIDEILEYIEECETLEGCPAIKNEHLPVFATSFGSFNVLEPMDHLNMMAAVQPFLSSAISKTCNVPEETTPEQIKELYIEGWKLGLKAVAIYRDNSKRSQPVSVTKEDDDDAKIPEVSSDFIKDAWDTYFKELSPEEKKKVASLPFMGLDYWAEYAKEHPKELIVLDETSKIDMKTLREKFKNDPIAFAEFLQIKDTVDWTVSEKEFSLAFMRHMEKYNLPSKEELNKQTREWLDQNPQEPFEDFDGETYSFNWKEYKGNLYPFNLESGGDGEPSIENKKEIVEIFKPMRKKLPDDCESVRHKFSVGGTEGYVHVGLYPDTGKPGEIFITCSKQGSTIQGLLDCFAVACSTCFQWGVPLDDLVEKFSFTRFEPSGMTGNRSEDTTLRTATSIVDYIFRWLASQDFDPKPFDASDVSWDPPKNGVVDEIIFYNEEDKNSSSKMELVVNGTSNKPSSTTDAPSCGTCGNITQRSGACYSCPICGETTGCG